MTRIRVDAAALQVLAREHENDIIAAACTLLPEAASLAVAPVSKFYVGAVAIDDRGNAFFGANQEFAGMPLAQTVHAEQSAIAHAWMAGATRLMHMVVTHAPCGHCRQFMSELHDAGDLHVHLPHSRNMPFADYLPGRFGPADLGIEAGLLHPSRQALAIREDDALAQLALDAAECSHAPYSRAWAGLALRLRDGRTFAGRYAENAAYNPSLPALQCALNLVHLHGASARDIAEGVLVCVPGQGHEWQTQTLWQSLTDAPLRICAAEMAA
ncbi:MAG: cytidine deaminase [Cardiobacteriaceae bacterium]|nr:cytidine deaminase [Cardiobacteriaceae bacterium]